MGAYKLELDNIGALGKGTYMINVLDDRRSRHTGTLIVQ